MELTIWLLGISLVLVVLVNVILTQQVNHYKESTKYYKEDADKQFKLFCLMTRERDDLQKQLYDIKKKEDGSI